MSDKTAFVFPGQGSQTVGMLAELAEINPQVRETFVEASQALGDDLWKLTQEGPAERLNQTDRTQPAMLVAGVAVWRVWRARDGAEPAYMAGHSLGEYTALVCAGALQFADAVRLVAERGRFMQEAVPEGQGAMAAVLGLDDDVIRQVCAEAAQGAVVDAVNFNAPGQVVIAGHREAVDRACEAAKAAGAKRALPLPVSVPAHSALMRPAADRLAQVLADVQLKTPRIPVVHNVDVTLAGSPDAIRDRLVQQVYSPVRWVETVQWLAEQGVGRLVEVGPGKVLAGLTKRVDRSLTAQAVYDTATLDKAINEEG